MASIPTTPNTSPATNPQLAGILNMAPVPGPVSAVLPNGAPTEHAPASSVMVGGTGGNSFTVQLGAATAPAGTVPATNGGGQVVVGGGTAPAAGAQPAAPGAPIAPGVPAAAPAATAAPAAAAAPVVPGVTAAPEAATTIVPTPTAGSAALPVGAAGTPAGTPVGSAGTGTDGVVGVAVAKSGFGKAERAKPMQATVDGANFGFPSFKASAKASKAPKVTWGPGWTKVQKDGMYYMQHTNGTKAIPAVEYRITPTPADKLQTVKVANGWGKKFPDGSIVVFDRTEGPYRLDAKGAKHKLGLGNQTIGGVKVRIFEAAVVRTLEKNGAVTVFDSRGQNKAGSPRGVAAAVAGAGAGAALVAGGPSSSKGGGAAKTEADLTGDVQKLTGIARGLLNQIRSGNLDQAELASLQAQLSALPAGILQAAGAAGATLPPTSTTTTAGGTTVAGGGTPPVAGADANAATSKLAAGAKGTLDVPVPAELVGKQARFGQLPEAVQQSIAKAYGSTQGVAALEADALVTFPTSGTVALVEGDTVYLKHVPQVRGAGPGEDLALTMRPTRQPGGSVTAAATPTAPKASGAGTGTAAAAAAATGAAAAAPATGGTTVAGSSAGAGAAAVGNLGAPTATSIPLVPLGGGLKSTAFNGLDGTYRWSTLPAPARDAIVAWLKNTPTEPAGAAFASRTGTGWVIRQDAAVTLAAGVVTFPSGLSLEKRTLPAPAATPAPAAGGTPAPGAQPTLPPGITSTPVGHDATQPPVAAGGGIGVVAPGTAPPVPTAPDGHVGH